VSPELDQPVRSQLSNPGLLKRFGKGSGVAVGCGVFVGGLAASAVDGVIPKTASERRTSTEIVINMNFVNFI